MGPCPLSRNMIRRGVISSETLSKEEEKKVEVSREGENFFDEKRGGNMTRGGKKTTGREKGGRLVCPEKGGVGKSSDRRNQWLPWTE